MADTNRQELPTSHREEYERHLAREWLLARQIGVSAMANKTQMLAGVRPFGHGPSFAELNGLPLAAVVVPLRTDHGGPGTAQIWVVHDPEDRLSAYVTSELTEMNAVLADAPGYRVFTVSYDTPNKGFVGRSWQLGGRLALRALREDSEHTTVLDLASRWIISGCVGSNGHAVGVVLGNKLRLSTDRDWLLPSENRGDIPDNWNPPGARRLASTEDAAWSLVSGKGTREEEPAEWPQKVYVLHSLVSGAWKPIVAAALLSGTKRMTLWHTNNEELSRSRAFALKEKVFPALAAAGIRIPEIGEPLLISSTNLAEAERNLRPLVEENLREYGTVLFNITNGNRLVALAPNNLARRHSGLCLVYRDVDDKGHDFTGIRYDDFEPTTFTLRPKELPHSDKLNWDALIARGSNTPPIDWDAELKEILY
ncbi:MAG TPA: hypothetical protein PKE26_05200 [Kiritimatiellia bacterium]|nr:hypothetical protein [Kiritimatiellia bacterium]HMO98489.1 hypothetical protein [Kiritimatiellia bacterium]HMP95797.1 hypothetical protein [Kiritimatiellia bacterium]